MRAFAVIICTYRREAWLASLLDALLAQVEVSERPEILVVDNDPLASARLVVAERPAVRYVHEPRRGVSHARNTAVAASEAPVLVMLDDDQVVDSGFMAAVEAAWSRRPPDVAGLRLKVLPLEPGRDHARGPRAPTRDPAYEAVHRGTFGTGGLVVPRTLLDALDGPFDLAFGQSGGEDTDLFVRASRLGARFACPDNVVVHERVPDARRAMSYQIWREFRAGGVDRTIDLKHGNHGLRKLSFRERLERWSDGTAWRELRLRAARFAATPDRHRLVARALAYRAGAYAWTLSRLRLRLCGADKPEHRPGGHGP